MSLEKAAAVACRIRTVQLQTGSGYRSSTDALMTKTVGNGAASDCVIWAKLATLTVLTVALMLQSCVCLSSVVS